LELYEPLSMFYTHGTDVAKWPTAVRELLNFPRDGR